MQILQEQISVTAQPPHLPCLANRWVSLSCANSPLRLGLLGNCSDIHGRTNAAKGQEPVAACVTLPPASMQSYDASVRRLAVLRSGFLQTFPHGFALAVG